MKRISILVLILVFCCAGAAWADKKEIDKGTILVGGGSNLGLLMGDYTIDPEKGDDIKADSTVFNLMAYGGYFVIDGLSVGPILGYSYGKVEADLENQDITGTLSMFDFGALGIYIFNIGKNKTWAPYASLALEYVNGSIKYEVDTPAQDSKSTSEMSGWSATPRGGIMFFLQRRIALDLSVFIKYISGSGSTKNGDKLEMDVTSLNYGFLLGLNGFLK